MSEPSPEAKQAAGLLDDWRIEKHPSGRTSLLIVGTLHYFTDGTKPLEWQERQLREIRDWHNTATAKLREELEDNRLLLTRAVKWIDRLCERRGTIPHFFDNDTDPCPLAKDIRRYLGLQQLAHQQPSEELTHDEIWDAMRALKQPSAPTADVEEIADWKLEPLGEKWPGLAYVVDPTGRRHGSMNIMVARGLVSALAQARAPLVELLEQLRAYCGVTGNMLIDAALTGTGGRTGNTISPKIRPDAGSMRQRGGK